VSIISDLIDEKVSEEEAALKALTDGETLAKLLEGTVSKQDKIRFSSYHVLLLISEHYPNILYP
jgi:DNA-directed RNA polymerase subunit L